jgi:hypothetical protein
MYDYTGYKLRHWNSNETMRKTLEAIPGKYSIDSLQQTAVLETPHLIRKVLQCETKPEWWASQLVQEKYRDEQACDKRR